jgi:serine protease Do
MMRRVRIAVVGACFAASAPGPAGAQPPFDAAALVKQVMASVVNISAIPPHDLAPGRDYGVPVNATVGSGFIISGDGMIVTNRHVVAGANRVLVTLSDGTVLRASVVGMAGEIDVAVLHINAWTKLQPVEWGDSDAVEVGEPVVAIGNPLGFGGTVTAGIVSALNRQIRSSPFDDFIQTDASINHGNSGGPLFDGAGHVIGMNTALESPTNAGGSIGINFSLPSNDVKLVADFLIRGGKPPPGWLGIEFQPLDPLISSAFNLPPGSGAIVAEVLPHGPAAAAGLVAGDIVVDFDLQPIRDVRGVLRLAAEHPAGTRVVLSVWHESALKSVPVVLGEWPAKMFKPPSIPKAAAASRTKLPDFGLTLQAATPALLREYHLPAGSNGVIITKLDPDGVAGDTRLRMGDMISLVQDTAVTTPKEFFAVVDDARDKGKFVVPLLVHRKEDILWIALPPNGVR